MTSRSQLPANLNIKLRRRLGVSHANRDTERFAEFIAGDRPESFLDVGTGSGYLAIRMALGGARVAATDISPRAKAVAEQNAQRNGVSLTVQISDLFEHVQGVYDAMAFNPPFSVKSDSLPIAVIKETVRRIRPFERLLMHHRPGRVTAFRRRLISRFLRQSMPHLGAGGGLYLLLYADEIGILGNDELGLVVSVYSPADLEARNLAFARLQRHRDRMPVH